MRSTPAVLLALVLLAAGCAGTPDYRAVTDSDQPVVRAGFSVLPPGGDGWVVPTEAPVDAIVFGKRDAEHARQRGTVVVSAMGLRARGHDISTAPGLLAEVDEWTRGPEGDRTTLVSQSLQPYRDQANATDCVRLTVDYQQRGNPYYPGETLAMPMWGKACRHPHVPNYFVLVSYSERRPAGTPTLMNDRLRAECERTVASLRFVPPTK